MTATWTQERIDRLRALYSAGNSAGAIGRLLGLSRNAVIGKLHRLGLTGSGKPRPRVRTAPQRPAQRRKPSAPPVAPHRPAPAAPEPPLAAVDHIPDVPDMAEPTGAVTVMDLRLPVSQCRWIDGETNGTATVFCGAPVRPGSSYCPEHRDRCRTPYRRRAAKQASTGCSA